MRINWRARAICYPKNLLTWTQCQTLNCENNCRYHSFEVFFLYFLIFYRFFSSTRVSCIYHKSKNYVHRCILRNFSPACRSLDSYAWFSETSGSCRRSTDESSTRNQSNFEVCVSHVILRFFTVPTCSAVKIVWHIWRKFSGRAQKTIKGEQNHG